MVVKLLNNKLQRVKFSNSFFFRFQTFFFIKSFLLQKLINILTRGGKKIKSEKLVIFYLKEIKKLNLSFSQVNISFFNIIDQAKPLVELVSKRIGKKIYQIPVPVRLHRQYLRCIRWIKHLTTKKKLSNSFSKLLFNEHNFIINDKNKSLLLKKKQLVYLTAVENRMFTHFRWY